KNPWLLLNTYNQYIKNKSNPEDLIIAGSGWDNKTVINFIKKNNLEDNIHLLGFISEEKSIELYNGAEIFIFPSFYEGFGMPNLEAMACGTPVITSSVFAIPEIVEDAALLLDNEKDSKELQNKMEYLQNNPQIKELLIQKGFNRVKDFSWHTSAKTIISVYDELLK
ncbi:MAG: glycosyltransferase family 1 protein, partial [Spirochaetaceae bacterium]|nr:glycosyltransferase family 1 protein [Spirochaetaceae bacterium]